VNSLRKVVSRGVHHGFDHEEGREHGVWTSIIEVREERVEEDERSSFFREGLFRGGGCATP